MKIALLGAAGRIGSEIREEALRRGHEVTAIVRSTGRLEEKPGLAVVVADAYDAASLASAIAGHDVFVSAFSPDPAEPLKGKPARLKQAHAAILDGVRASGVRRVLLVGGQGSLWTSPGVLVIDAPDYPAEKRPHSVANVEIYRDLAIHHNDLDWTYVSPPGRIDAGERTGTFRTALDEFLRDENGVSFISRADFAIAIVDELENEAHIRRRFTVAY